MSHFHHGYAMKLFTLVLLCFAITCMGFTQNASAQQIVIENPNPPKIQIKISPTLFTAGENGSFLLIKGGVNQKQKVYSYNIPEGMKATIKAYIDTGREIHAVALAPDGGWAVVGNGVEAHDKVGEAYTRMINRAMAQKRTITGLAFNHSNWDNSKSFVLLMGKQFVAHGISVEMNNVLSNYAKAGEHMHGVAFTPLGGWTVITNQFEFTRNVGHVVEEEGYFTRLKTLKSKKQKPLAVGFPPATYYERQKGWVIIGRDFVEAAWPSARLRRALAAAYPEKTKFYFPRKPQPSNKPKLAAGEKRIEFQISHLTIQEFTMERRALRDSFEEGGSEPIVFLYQFSGRINGKDNIIAFNSKLNPLVPGLYGKFHDDKVTLSTNWANVGRIGMIQPGAGSFTATLKPYEFFGVVAITMEYGEDHKVAEMKQWLDASFSVASKAFNRVNRNRMDQLNINDTKDFANNKNIMRNTILRMESFSNLIREDLHDEINKQMLKSRGKKIGAVIADNQPFRLFTPNFVAQKEHNFVRDVRVLYTINAPEYDKNSPTNAAVAQQWNQVLGYAKGYVAIDRRFINKPNESRSKAGTRHHLTPITFHGLVKNLD